MAVKVRVHPFHVHLVDGQEVVEVQGRTVGECLTALVARYPALKSELFDKHGNLRNYLEVYLNNQSTYPEELKHPVSDGDELSIIMIAQGG